VPQQRLVGHLHQLVAATPIAAGDQQPLIGESADYGLPRFTQLPEAGPAA
jgi:hypothetical protein